MKTVCLLILLVHAAQAQWRVALPGWKFDFPRDHGSHPDFKTEWWYFTGSLEDEQHRSHGYELTFFRQGIRPPAERKAGESQWIAQEIALAHFAITDVAGKRFVFDHRMGREALDWAGFGQGERLAWIDDWSLQIQADNSWRLVASADEIAIDLTLKARKDPVPHGRNGVSQKSSGEGRASHYYSLTRLATTGRLRIAGEERLVTGLTWFDHEWATNQLTREQTGWDWFGLHLDDGSDLMLYQLRMKKGGADPASSGTLVRPDGQIVHLQQKDFRLESLHSWRSSKTDARYPLRWKIEVPSEGMSLQLQPELQDQEMRVPPAAYWEGAVRVRGVRQGKEVGGRGYMELTGYGGQIRGISE